MKPYEWMVTNTPQSEWIQKRGVLLWLAFFFIELGAGVFFVASIFDSFYAMLTGWLVCAMLGGGLHLMFLGKPARFWRMVLSSGWKTSWISRGLSFVVLFLIFGLVHMVVAQTSGAITALVFIADIFAFLTIIYGGFAMNYVNGIPLWNTAILPVLYVVSGLWGGAEVTIGTSLAGGSAVTGAAVETWIRILLIGYIILVPVYLMSVRYTSATGQVSVSSMVRGWSALFWLAVVVVGMMIPLIAVVTSFVMGLEATSPALLYLAILCGLVGDMSMRYLILRLGMYGPLIPATSYA